jgi:hypothetical protein
LTVMVASMTGVHAQPRNAAEGLIQAPPSGFKVVARDVNKTWMTIYMVPEGQTATFWKERFSTQIIYNPKSTSFFTFSGEQQRRWRDLCDASSIDYVEEGVQNGYTTHLWLQACRFRDAKNKPIFALTKMIDGDQHAYAVQIVFRYLPGDAELNRWISYLNAVELCGARSSGKRCTGVTASR